MKRAAPSFALVAALAAPAVTLAAPPDDDAAGASVSLDGEISTEDGANASGDVVADKWIKRYRPRPRMAELGVFGGFLFPSPRHGLYEDTELSERPNFNSVAPELGVRLAFFPIRHFGIEAEGGAAPVKASGSKTTLLLPKAHLVGQIGLWSVTPFVVFGVGAIGMDNGSNAVGSDTDPAIHFGGGLKFFLNEWVALRLDVRDNVSRSCLTCSGPGDELSENGYRAHHPEILLGLSLTLTLEKKEKRLEAPPPAAKPPPPPKDTDGDGILDPDDSCPTVPETVNDFQDLDGCPEYDKDGDGFWNIPDQDACPDVPGVAPDGCPANKDTDGDGYLDTEDGCPQDPENFNGYKDKDGCPDVIPDEVKKFIGVIEGIYFDTNKDSIKKKSEGVLEGALVVFKKYPELRVKISGHTDIRGSHEHNMDLSRRRAASVKNWLVDHGIDTERLVTEGFGPDEPIGDNASKAGRQKNRRIEFELVR
jgi:OOP family OmpA-OmpF porin